MTKYITIPKFAEISGYSEDAIRTKISRGHWPKSDVWTKAPDGRILINVEGYTAWVEEGQVLKPHQKAALKSPSRIKASGAASGSNSSPPPLT